MCGACQAYNSITTKHSNGHMEELPLLISHALIRAIFIKVPEVSWILPRDLGFLLYRLACPIVPTFQSNMNWQFRMFGEKSRNLAEKRIRKPLRGYDAEKYVLSTPYQVFGKCGFGTLNNATACPTAYYTLTTVENSLMRLVVRSERG
jgi:hypothetical protein